MDIPSFIEQHLTASSNAILSLRKQNQLIATVKGGGCIYTCGNGGSACEAMHLAEELVARYKKERPGIRAQHLCDAGTITCWANDYNFDDVFARQVETHITNKDLLLVFSTSGGSENILRALSAANKLGATTVALLGKSGGKAKSLAKIPLVVESDVTAHIQEVHLAIVHMLCEILENSLFA